MRSNPADNIESAPSAQAPRVAPRVAKILKRPQKPWHCIVRGCGVEAPHGDFCEPHGERYKRVTAREWPDLSTEDQKWLVATEASLTRRYAALDGQVKARAKR